MRLLQKIHEKRTHNFGGIFARYLFRTWNQLTNLKKNLVPPFKVNLAGCRGTSQRTAETFYIPVTVCTTCDVLHCYGF